MPKPDNIDKCNIAMPYQNLKSIARDRFILAYQKAHQKAHPLLDCRQTNNITI